MAAGTMKTSYYLVAAAGLTAAAAVAYDHLPAQGGVAHGHTAIVA